MTDIAPNIKIPLELKNGSFVTHEQDTPDEVVQCAMAVLSTPLGTRASNPDFGLPDQTFREGGPSVEQIRTTLDLWEPRADALVSSEPDLINQFVYNVEVGVQTTGDISG